ncbi:MAG TPA: hypothetical protein VFT05_07050 [Burkholderiaceae bacterium]|nr:hypothetical protein [Burkholderiaceae bacterium]
MEQQPTQTTHPAKQAVRDSMQRRRSEHTPPPPPERVRQELGWWLIPENRSAS